MADISSIEEHQKKRFFSKIVIYKKIDICILESQIGVPQNIYKNKIDISTVLKKSDWCLWLIKKIGRNNRF